MYQHPFMQKQQEIYDIHHKFPAVFFLFHISPEFIPLTATHSDKIFQPDLPLIHLFIRLKYQMPKIEGKPNPACRCGDVLQGKCKPSDCKVFGKGCTPQHPIGACMVSGEGACSAYYQYS